MELVVNKKYLLGIVLFVLLLSIGAGGYYFYKNNEINKQISKLDYQLEELPELEKDVFTKCMVGKDGTAQNIAYCQENTQEQMFTLSQDLSSAKKSLESKNIIEVLK